LIFRINKSDIARFAQMGQLTDFFSRKCDTFCHFYVGILPVNIDRFHSQGGVDLMKLYGDKHGTLELRVALVHCKIFRQTLFCRNMPA
jgi:hypothetical protein